MNTLQQQYKEIQQHLTSQMNWSENCAYTERIGQFEFQNIPIKQKFIEHPNFIICYGEWQLSNEINVPLKLDKNTFKMQFEIEGYSCFRNKKIEIEIPEDCCNLFFVCKPEGELYYKKNRRVIEIVFDEDYFMNALANKFFFLKQFVEKIKDNKTICLFEHSKSITPEIHKLLIDLLYNNIHSSIKQDYLAHKIEEILLLLYNLTLPKYQHYPKSFISLSDEDKILNIKNWIDANFLQEINYKKLCSLFFINELKLKRNFKKYYKNSIIKYIKTLRFEHAYSLLESGKYSITEVANLLHYEYPQHFSIAFKKIYNIAPSNVKRK